MKILYLSCHGVLEFDEVKLLTELGHEVFCLGDIGGNERPFVQNARDNKCNWFSRPEIEEMRKRGQMYLPDFAVERCDAIICMHIDSWLSNQWQNIKKKKCFLRLIGQHRDNLGATLKPMTDDGLKVIQCWHNDAKENDLLPEQSNLIANFYKDEAELQGWTGELPMVLTVNNDIRRGGNACHPNEYLQATDGLPRLLVGKNNRFFGDFTARLPYWMLLEAYKRHRVYLFMNTEPCTYVLNLVEAMMTGMPIVAYDNGRGIKDIVPFASNDPEELREMLEGLLAMSPAELKVHSRRDRAIELFGKKRALEAWKKVLE